MKYRVLLAACAVLGLVLAEEKPLPTVVLAPGTVIGTTTSLPSSTATVKQFLGIPYAVTPPRRFLPPEPLQHYDGPVNATAWQRACMQSDNLLETAAQIADESEDCLYLNIYVPESCGCGKPVMFWIYGGDLQFGTGSDPQFDGTSLAANQDVIVVTFNYRVNAFGFSNSPYLPLKARNVGFWDQRMALSWVHDNIAAFGGDPGKVTIFGESSGASSVDRLLTTMLVDPPFYAAITESGQATVSALPNDNGPEAWAALVAALNCSSPSSAAGNSSSSPGNSTSAAANATVADLRAEFYCMQAADALTIRTIVNNLAVTQRPFTPVNDNVTQIETPFLAARQAGRVAKVPLLSGTNGQEGMLLSVIYEVPDYQAITEAMLDDLVTTITGSNTTVTLIQPILDEIESLFPWYDPFEVFAQLYTEVVYQCPCKWVTEASAQDDIPTWRYYFNATFANVQYAGYPSLGAFHSSELDLVWGTYPANNATDQEVALSTFMQTAWANFAKNASAGPGWEAVGGTGNDLACLGCDGSTGVQMIAEDLVDSRCSVYAPLYTATTPYF